MSIRAILFDLDGVLVEFADAHFRALNSALAEVAGTVITDAERNRYEGLPTQEKLKILIAIGRVRKADCQLIYERKQALTAAMATEVKPDPIKVRMLAALQPKYKLACVSNCVRESVDRLLKAAGLLGFMSCTVSNQDAKPKPDPEPYALACRLIEIDPNEGLAVEDHERGLSSAKDAGLHVVQMHYPEVRFARIMSAIRKAKQCPAR